MFYLTHVLIGVAATLFAHLGMVSQLSLVGRSYDATGGFRYPITKNRFHLIGLSLAVCGGVIVALPWPNSLTLLKVLTLGSFLLGDMFFVFKAVRSVEKPRH
jgi:O-antigen/teichoic acid export membrane protein